MKTDYAEIVSDTPFDTVMQELVGIAAPIVPAILCKILFGVSVASGNDGLRNNNIYSGHSTPLRGPLVVTEGSGTDRTAGHPHSSSSRKLPVTVETAPSPQPPKKRFGQIILSAIDRIERELKKKRAQRTG